MTVQIRELEPNGTVVNKTIKGHSAMVRCLDTNANGDFVVTGSGRPRPLSLAGTDHSVRIWKTDTGKEVWSKKELPEELVSVDLSDDTSSVLGVTASDTAYLWDRDSGQLKFQLRGLHCGEIAFSFPPTFAANSQRVWGLLKSGELAVWDAKSGEVVRVFREEVVPSVVEK